MATISGDKALVRPNDGLQMFFPDGRADVKVRQLRQRNAIVAMAQPPQGHFHPSNGYRAYC